MTRKLPDALSAVVDQLARLPGLGPKSALRAAMTLLRWPEGETRRLGAAVYDLRDRLHLCPLCGALTDVTPCALCTDPARSRDMLCVTADWDSMLTIENSGFYSGLYFILGSLPAATGTGIGDDGTDLRRLDERVAGEEIKEVVLALGATVEAEQAESLLCARLRRRRPDMRVSRLAQGINLAQEVRFVDRDTLRQSFKYRQHLA
ncbi:MAG: recombination protein RecR [Desulfovibrio sp.]|jgi:recombination protein RecR|nr:recombination protein RecR [Desulfovibrio sp.]